VVGDYTARAARTQLLLTGTPPHVTPVAYSVRVQMDMQDRVVGFSATIPAGGGRVTFSPAFFVTPAIGLSEGSGQEGDHYTISNKTVDGFDIAFTNNGTPVPRSISGVAKAYGARAA
jgi:hypothetical protein